WIKCCIVLKRADLFLFRMTMKLHYMDEAGEIKRVLQQEQINQGKPDNREETKQEHESIPILDEEQLAEDFEEKHVETKHSVVDKQLEARKVGENQADPSKKPKLAPKKAAKAKTTVPQPFSLATEKRMSRERRASVDLSSVTEKKVIKERRASLDFKDLEPKLTKSASLKHK
ncbi:hypothetical protein Tsubulata_014534, partial [Turnera subulata]